MSKPNVLIITTHDTGRHFGCYGVKTVRTPAIDQLAAEGLQFDQMMSTCAICSPSRGCMLTGRQALNNGLVGLAGGVWNWELMNYQDHLSHRLQAQGYHCAMFGLQHETVFIDRMGFHDTSAHGIRRNDRQHSATDVAGDFEAFLADYDGDAPFYAQIGFFETHTPYNFAGCEPDSELGAWNPPYTLGPMPFDWNPRLFRMQEEPAYMREHLAGLQGMIAEVDRAVARIDAALATHGRREDTIVIFTVDHGVELPNAKWTLHDAGIGIAFIMRWPGGGVGGGRHCDWLLSNVDVLPTLYDLIGLRQPGDFDGVSFAGACRGDTGATPTRDHVMSHWVDGLVMGCMTPDYNVIRELKSGSDGHQAVHVLYDRAMDPNELVDAAAEPAYAEALANGVSRIDAWLAELHCPSMSGPLQATTHTELVEAYRSRYEADRGITRLVRED